MSRESYKVGDNKVLSFGRGYFRGRYNYKKFWAKKVLMSLSIKQSVD